MGDYADDESMNYGAEFAQEFIDDQYDSGDLVIQSKSQLFRNSKQYRFQVRVVHRVTGGVEWTGIVNATSGKNAQAKFRKEYQR